MSDEPERPRSNGIDTEAALGFISQVENLQSEIDELALRFKEKAKPLRQAIAQVKRYAMDAGIGKRELGAVLKKRRFEAKAARVDDALDLEQRANFQEMLASLERMAEIMGPLGQAALDQAKQQAGAAA